MVEEISSLQKERKRSPPYGTQSLISQKTDEIVMETNDCYFLVP